MLYLNFRYNLAEIFPNKLNKVKYFFLEGKTTDNRKWMAAGMKIEARPQRRRSWYVLVNLADDSVNLASRDRQSWKVHG